MSRAQAYVRSGQGKRPLMAAFDTETLGLGGRILAGSWMLEGQQSANYVSGPNTVQDLFYTMCENHQYTWFAHNAQYDLRYFLDCLKMDMDRLHIYMRTDADIFMIVVDLPEYGENAQLVIKDSLALFPQSLAKFTESFCPELPKLKLDFDHIQFDPKNEDHIAYAKRDVEALLKALIRFDDLLFETFDVHAKATTASTALAAWQRSLDKQANFRPPHNKHDGFIRDAYYGGLVFLTDTRKINNAQTYDVNSSYPYQMMTHPVPIGNPERTKFFDRRYLGIYRVIVRAPDDIIVPILPVRDRKGIVWPSGQFETTVTSIDLEFALDHGYRLLAVLEGICWEKSDVLFKPFVEKCRHLRQQYKGQPLEIVAKLMQNSLYGKFGSKKERRKIYASLPDDDETGFEAWGDFFIRDEIDDEMLAMPQWAAFVTAYARRHLLHAIYEVGPANVLYGDTDSLTVRQGYAPANVGNDYGQFKHEKQWGVFKARAPKVYAGDILTDQGIKRIGAIKGIPRKRWHDSGALDIILAGENGTVTYTTLPNLLDVMKGNPGEAYQAKRSISIIENSRTWKLLPDGRVRPKKFAEIKIAPFGQSDSASTFGDFGLESDFTISRAVNE
jgi:hypothetical protein